MIRIEDRTIFEADITTVFDAERNISLHQATKGGRIPVPPFVMGREDSI